MSCCSPGARAPRQATGHALRVPGQAGQPVSDTSPPPRKASPSHQKMRMAISSLSVTTSATESDGGAPRRRVLINVCPSTRLSSSVVEHQRAVLADNPFVSRTFARGRFEGSERTLRGHEMPASERTRGGGPQGSRTPDLRRAKASSIVLVGAVQCHGVRARAWETDGESHPVISVVLEWHCVRLPEVGRWG